VASGIYATLNIEERISAAIQLGESHFREFKSALEGPESDKQPRPLKLLKRDIGEALVAFANADGGELLLGVEDNRTITGVPHRPGDIEALLDAAKTQIHPQTPLPEPLRTRVEIEGKTVLYFATTKSTRLVHLTSDGRCLQRRDRESVPVPPQQIQFERQEQVSREYDRQFVDGAHIESLDLDLLTRAGQDIAPGMSPEKLLQLLDLADFSGPSAHLRRAALLLFASDVRRWHPRSEVRILRVSGTELKTGKEYNVTRDDTVGGAVFELISKAWETLRSHLVQTKLSSDGRFLESIMYPEDACREALINAIAHRDYSIEGRAIEILVFDDRMEVRSPGALLSNVRIEELKKLQGLHQSRNALIARVLKELRYMREMGEGFRRMFQLMKANDLVEPELLGGPDSFSVVLHHKSVLSESAQRWLAGYERLNLTREERKLVLLGQDGATFSTQAVWDALDIVDTEDYRALLEGLQLKGLLIPKISKNAAVSQARNRKVDKRAIPRFGIRTPQEVEVFLTEMFREFQRCGRSDRITPQLAQRVIEHLTPSNPFKTSPATLLRGLHRLGLVDSDRRPIGALHSLMESAPEAGVGDELLRGTTDPRRFVGVRRQTRRFEPRAGTDETNRAIFVGNLDADVNEQDLRDLFARFGEVDYVRIPLDLYTGRSRGFAFVRMRQFSAAKEARDKLDGRMHRGRVLSLDWDRKPVPAYVRKSQ
jgi:ATP-dependent DNA helicase RecG